MKRIIARRIVGLVALRVIAPVVVALFLTGSSEAGVEGIVEIWQPFVEAGSLTLTLHAVPYSTFGYRNHSLPLVAAENRTWRTNGAGAFENLNAASLAGLDVRNHPSPDPLMGFWGDTLRVVLDTSRLDVTRLVDRTSPDSLIAATIECLRATARPAEGSPGNAVSYLEVEVVPSRGTTFVFDLREPRSPRREFGLVAN